jgi:hypothetical protein
VHINRVLRSLRAEQIVNVEKHSVMILDLARLAILVQKRAAATSRVTGTEGGLNKAAD